MTEKLRILITRDSTHWNESSSMSMRLIHPDVLIRLPGFGNVEEENEVANQQVK